MKTILVIIACFLLLSLTSCTHELGYAGKNPGAVECAGKATMSFTGQGAFGPGGSANNAGSITFDCGSGAYLKQGQPDITNPPNPAPAVVLQRMTN